MKVGLAQHFLSRIGFSYSHSFSSDGWVRVSRSLGDRLWFLSCCYWIKIALVFTFMLIWAILFGHFLSSTVQWIGIKRHYFGRICLLSATRWMVHGLSSGILIPFFLKLRNLRVGQLCLPLPMDCLNLFFNMGSLIWVLLGHNTLGAMDVRALDVSRNDLIRGLGLQTGLWCSHGPLSLIYHESPSTIVPFSFNQWVKNYRAPNPFSLSNSGSKRKHAVKWLEILGNLTHAGSHAFQLIQKTAACKTALQTWNRDSVGLISSSIRHLQSQLELIEQLPSTNLSQATATNLQTALQEALRQEKTL